MSAMKNSAVALLATAFAIAAFPAFAANAYVLEDSPVYEEPSNSSDEVNEVFEDDEVTVTECTTNYCFIQIDGPNGWIRKNRLGSLDEEGDPADVPFNFGITVGPGGPSISLGLGGGGGGIVIGPGGGQVCFYKNNNYSGSYFCRAPGQSANSIGGGMNNAISSIKISGGAEVTVCKGTNMNPACTTYTNNKSSLGGYNDTISSYEVN